MKNLKKLSRFDLKTVFGGRNSLEEGLEPSSNCGGSYCETVGGSCANVVYGCTCKALNSDPSFKRCVSA